MVIFKLVDHTVGWFLIFLLAQFYPRRETLPVETKTIKKILLIRPGGIGDAVWALPVVRLLKNKMAGCEVDVLCEKRNAAVFRFSSDVPIRHVILYDTNLITAFKKIMDGNYDLAIDTEQYHNFSAIFSYLAAKKYRIGFDTVSLRSKLYTHRVPYDHKAKEYTMFLSLLQTFMEASPEEYLRNSRLKVSEMDDQWAIGLLNHRKPVTLFIGSSVRERFWGEDKFAGLCAALIQKNHLVVLAGGPQDIKIAHNILRQLKPANDVINLVGKISLIQTAAILKNSVLVVGADSGIMHLSYAVGSPSIWLLGAGIEEKWLPPDNKQVPINLYVGCSPCTLFGYTPRCPYRVKCLSRISVDMVLSRMESLLS